MPVSTKELKINQEFKNLIPPLTKEEYKGLEKSLLEEGCRDALVTWNGTIVDGHNRYELCQKHGIDFDVIEKEFENEEEAKVWIIDNQNARRNLTDGWKFELKQTRKKILSEKGKENQGIRTDLLSKTDKKLNINKVRNHNTQKEIAKELGWSTGKVAQADVVWKKGPEEIKEKVKAGDMSINEAYRKVRIMNKKEKNIEDEQKSVQSNKPEIYEESYKRFLKRFEEKNVDLIITDPPFMTDVDNIYNFVNQWLPKALKKLKDSGKAYIFTGAYPEELHAYLGVLLNQKRFVISNVLVWTYKNLIGTQTKKSYRTNWQAIFYLYGKSADDLHTNSMLEKFAVKEINAPDGRQGNRYFKWQKPNELAAQLIKHSTKESQLVIDPFAGSGTFLIEAAKLGRVAKGSEINKEVIDIAVQRGCEKCF